MNKLDYFIGKRFYYFVDSFVTDFNINKLKNNGLVVDIINIFNFDNRLKIETKTKKGWDINLTIDPAEYQIKESNDGLILCKNGTSIIFMLIK